MAACVDPFEASRHGQSLDRHPLHRPYVRQSWTCTIPGPRAAGRIARADIRSTDVRRLVGDELMRGNHVGRRRVADIDGHPDPCRSLLCKPASDLLERASLLPRAGNPSSNSTRDSAMNVGCNICASQCSTERPRDASDPAPTRDISQALPRQLTYWNQDVFDRRRLTL
jgi:hypothetical protein